MSRNGMFGMMFRGVLLWATSQGGHAEGQQAKAMVVREGIKIRPASRLYVPMCPHIGITTSLLFFCKLKRFANSSV
jgi:hypothetical protein